MQNNNTNSSIIALLALVFLGSHQPCTWADEDIQGTWEVYKVVINGRQQRLDTDSPPTVEIGETTLTLMPGEGLPSRKFKITVGVEADLKIIDMKASQKPYNRKWNKGIYRFTTIKAPAPKKDNEGKVIKDGNGEIVTMMADRTVLQICIPNRVGKTRPTRYESTRGDDWTILTLLPVEEE
ncbi:MAG: hypothetical protein ACFCD0_28300 [Gemmataceae bacterium]